MPATDKRFGAWPPPPAAPAAAMFAGDDGVGEHTKKLGFPQIFTLTFQNI